MMVSKSFKKSIIWALFEYSSFKDLEIILKTLKNLKYL